MDTKEKKEKNKEQKFCSDLNQNSLKTRIKTKRFSNINGIIVLGLIIAFMLYIFIVKESKIRLILSENLLVIILIVCLYYTYVYSEFF